MMAAALGFGLLVGALLGLLGAGGSILAVPALVYGVGIPFSDAVPTSLIVVGVSSAVGVLPRLRREVDWRLGLIIGVTGAASAFAGTAVNRILNQNVLLLIFAGIMVIAGIRMLRPTESPNDPASSRPQGRGLQFGTPKAIAAGLVVGFLTGLLGVGGGFLILPVLVIVLGVPMSIAIGTSLLIIVINSIGGIVSHASNLGIDWPITILFATAAMAASLAGGRASHYISDRVLQRGFAALVLLTAAFVAVKTTAGMA